MSPIRDTRAITPAFTTSARPTPRSGSRRFAARFASLGLAAGLVAPAGFAVTSVAAPVRAEAAATPMTATSSSSGSVSASATLRIARAQKGKPYRRGAAGPRAFDCSGLVKYVMKRQHHYVPRTAQAQYRAAKKIAKSKIRRGDLVFFTSGGRVYHVGIYAGHKRIWHSPKPGSRVKLAKIWTSRWKAGRVRS